MGNPRPSNTPPLWENQDIVLYHGTTKTSADLIRANGIDLAQASPKTDFGRGFYTTTSLRQAQNWAWRIADEKKDEPMVLSYQIQREAIAKLDSLFFVDGSYENDVFWSFVFHCRLGNEWHKQDKTMLYYDIVIGPIAAFWKDRVAMLIAEQISFHTDTAIKLLVEAQTIGVKD